MEGVAIARLSLRGPAHLAGRAAFLVEDCCRTELPGGGRLTVVRRMDLGRGGTARDQPERAAAMRRAYASATAGARRARDPGAAAANCVWFESRAEAETLLLAELLAGRAPVAWYWRLALPDWRGEALEPWLERCLAPTSLVPERRDPVEVVLQAVEAGAADLVVSVLTRGGAFQPEAAPAASGGFRAPHRSLPTTGPDILPEELEIRRALTGLVARLPVAARNAVERVVRRLPRTAERAATRLLERLLLRGSPALSLSPLRLRALASLYLGHLSGAPRLVESASEAAPLNAGSLARARGNDPRSSLKPDRLQPEEPRPAAEKTPATARERIIADQAHVIAATPPVPAIGTASQAAGLWLAIPSLIRLGFREFLAGRPGLLANDGGRTLLRLIGDRHRVAADDPALAALGEWEPEAAPDWAVAWRTGLDRWLRRKAGFGLHRLVWRAGSVRLCEERLTIAFPPEAADIRLRRHALDVDPGWTDWLGLSVRYDYCGESG